MARKLVKGGALRWWLEHLHQRVAEAPSGLRVRVRIRLARGILLVAGLFGRDRRMAVVPHLIEQGHVTQGICKERIRSEGVRHLRCNGKTLGGVGTTGAATDWFGDAVARRTAREKMATDILLYKHSYTCLQRWQGGKVVRCRNDSGGGAVARWWDILMIVVAVRWQDGGMS